MVYEAQGLQAEHTEKAWEAKKASWAGKLAARADCMAVARATTRAGASLRDQFKHGGCYKHEAFAALKEVAKVEARKNREQAKQEGLESRWKGNNAADEIAKLSRPKLQCKEKQKQQTV